MLKLFPAFFFAAFADVKPTVPARYHYDTVTTVRPNPGWNDDFERVNQTCSADSLFNENECVTACDDSFYACLRLCDSNRDCLKVCSDVQETCRTRCPCHAHCDKGCPCKSYKVNAISL